MYWGDILYDTAICSANEQVTIGPQPNNTFILDLGSSQNSFRLAHGAFVLD